MNRSKTLSLLVVLAVGFSITLWFAARVHTPSASGAFQSNGESSALSTTLTACYGFAVTLFGVLLGAIYRRLVKLRGEGVEAIGPLAMVKTVLVSIDFQIGIVGAPIIYGLLWQSLADVSLVGLSVIALQNGFTAHAILDQFTSAKPPNSET